MGTAPSLLPSGLHDIELVDPVEALDLQPNGSADLGLELTEARRLGLEQPLDHVRMRQDQKLAGGFVCALAQDLAEDLVADGLGRLHEATSLTRPAGLAEQVLETLARALAGHLHQTERRETHYVALRAVAGEGVLERTEHLAAMRLIVHVDEVDDDDAAEVAQTQLPADAGRRLEIGAERGFLQVAVAHVGAGVDVDRGQRLPLIDHEVAAGFELDLVVERPGDLLLDAMQIEYRPRTGVQLDATGRRGHELL